MKRDVLAADAQARRRNENNYVRMRYKQLKKIRKLRTKQEIRRTRRQGRKQTLLGALSAGF